MNWNFDDVKKLTSFEKTAIVRHINKMRNEQRKINNKRKRKW